jgi:hypothetical protein
MTAERAAAYRRVIQTLVDLGSSKLLASEQDLIRDADRLVFSPDQPRDVMAHDALEVVERLCRALVDSGRWVESSAMRLADDVAECGPTVLPDLNAA